jgi:hypothetical protein
MEDELEPRWKTFLKAINELIEHWIDVATDNMGCTIGCLVSIVVLLIFLAVGWVAYDSYVHRNQHCVLAHTTYVLVGKVLTPTSVCDQWQNN